MLLDILAAIPNLRNLVPMVNIVGAHFEKCWPEIIGSHFGFNDHTRRFALLLVLVELLQTTQVLSELLACMERRA